MSVNFNNNEPIYLQLLDHFHAKIVSGVWPPGARIDSVRSLALEFGVNPNTVQRALQELEREGLSYTERTAGRFVTDNTQNLDALKKSLLQKEIDSLLKMALSMGLSLAEVMELVKASWPLEKRGDRG